MSPEEYTVFLDRVAAWARHEPDVLAVVAVGSTGDTRRAPDAWSDHDLLLVTADGAAERLRSDLSWLPGAEMIVLAHRGTPEALSVVRADGHLVEVAVFDDSELEHLDFDTHRLLVGDEDMALRLDRMRARTDTEVAAADPSGDVRAGRLVFEILVGLKRWSRGERLSAHHRIRGEALRLLLGLVADLVPAESTGAGLDGLDPHRRFERAYPRRAVVLDHALHEVPSAATAIVEIMEADLVGRVPGLSAEVLAVLRAAVGTHTAREVPAD